MLSRLIQNCQSGALMIGIHSALLTDYDIKRLKHPSVSGVILFSRNIQSKLQLKALCQAIHRVKKNLLIGIDQEGGRVQRLKGDDFVDLPSLYSIGKNYDHEPKKTINQIIEHAETIAKMLKSCDIDLCFSPVIDLYHKDSQIIAERAFSDNPETVIILSDYYIKTLLKFNIIPVVKHFPGHGNIIYDTHQQSVIDQSDLNTLNAHDLKPFLYHIKNNIPLMASHILYPNIDPEITSFSSFWLKTYLRDNCHFKGLIFSDDLGMQAAINAAKNRFLCIEKALSAGCDIAIIGNDFDMIDAYLSDQVAPKALPV